MNGPFVVAQANTGGASATPVQVLKLIKPKAGEPATHMLLYDPNGRTAGGTQVSLAVLENGGTVDAAHIHMV